MKISKDELISVLAQFNPWWRGERIADIPKWRRATFHELFNWVNTPPALRAILLSGARQVGKTTLLLQVIEELLKQGVPSANIIYATFDHPIIKLAGIDSVLEAWREREPKANGHEYLFLDEAQFIREWGTWVKHQVDFIKNRRIIFTGSSMPLTKTKQESGVGRWHTISLSTLSFYEYLQLRQVSPPDIAPLKSLQNLYEWSQKDFYRSTEIIKPYIGHFHGYLQRGGFPQTAQIESIPQAQRLMREDIVDKILKRDMTALFGVRRVLELEQTFLYLCMHDGGLLDIPKLCSNLEVKRPTVLHFIELLEATHLVYRLRPYGYGKDILRAKYKIYLADAAISSAVLLKGERLLENSTALGAAVETTVFKHLFTRYYQQNIRFTYWQGNKEREVDLIAEIENQIVPFEIKYRSQHTEERDLEGLLEFCQKKTVKRGYVITKSSEDFGPLTTHLTQTKIMRIPAVLLCYWMGEDEQRIINSNSI